MVLSLGTGSEMHEMNYSAESAAKWGLLGWSLDDNINFPLISAYTNASADMVDYHLSVIFGALQCQTNYLRIQVSITYALMLSNNCI